MKMNNVSPINFHKSFIIYLYWNSFFTLKCFCLFILMNRISVLSGHTLICIILPTRTRVSLLKIKSIILGAEWMVIEFHLEITVC